MKEEGRKCSTVPILTVLSRNTGLGDGSWEQVGLAGAAVRQGQRPSVQLPMHSHRTPEVSTAPAPSLGFPFLPVPASGLLDAHESTGNLCSALL